MHVIALEDYNDVAEVEYVSEIEQFNEIVIDIETEQIAEFETPVIIQEDEPDDEEEQEEEQEELEENDCNEELNKYEETEEDEIITDDFIDQIIPTISVVDDFIDPVSSDEQIEAYSIVIPPTNANFNPGVTELEFNGLFFEITGEGSALRIFVTNLVDDETIELTRAGNGHFTQNLIICLDIPLSPDLCVFEEIQS